MCRKKRKARIVTGISQSAKAADGEASLRKRQPKGGNVISHTVAVDIITHGNEKVKDNCEVSYRMDGEVIFNSAEVAELEEIGSDGEFRRRWREMLAVKRGERVRDNRKKTRYADGEDVKWIIDTLNAVLGTKYKVSSAKTKACINARFSEGYGREEFAAVISHMASEWLGDEKMQCYLRPETLFGTKFESYLQRAGMKKASEASIQSGGSFDTDEFFNAALKRSYGGEYETKK